MNIAILKETEKNECRVSVIPDHVSKMTQLGVSVYAESGLGSGVDISDKQYEEAGAKIVSDRVSLLKEADMVIGINKPVIDDIKSLKKGCIYISYLDPYNEKSLIEACAKQGVRALSVEMVPRSTRAQKMDVLSSQASLAGYVMVIIAANKLKKIYPMMVTPSGTISPARVFIIGAGVAGLQAIATAKRLGARVDAFDTRAVVEEEVKSLGGKFLKIDIGETGQTKDGYAKALTPEQLEKQRAGLAKVCANSDIVITTAQIPGKKAPRIITKEMLANMQPGSVVVDMAVASGGNVEGSEVDKEVDIDGVCVIGVGNLPSRVAVHASQMYSANMYNFFSEFWDKEKKELVLDQEDEIVAGCLITDNGAISNDTIKTHYSGKGE
ncbi:MAG: NAD(P) transhydrogenase subunit alpha [Gammaproteobacteria bacterium]|nr:NAD(P) transhydrogenase subunit alpha [Gammaproteobacteria bacterium]